MTHHALILSTQHSPQTAPCAECPTGTESAGRPQKLTAMVKRMRSPVWRRSSSPPAATPGLPCAGDEFKMPASLMPAVSLYGMQLTCYSHGGGHPE